MKKLILFFAVMFLTGCASMNPSPEVMQTKALRVQAQHQLASKPFLVLNCVSGCSAVMHDPRAATYIDRVEAKGAADVAIKALGVADSVISKGVIGYAGASIAKAIVKNAGEKNFNAGGDINNDTPSTTISNSSIDGTQDNSVVTTTRDGDEYVGDQNGNAGTFDSSSHTSDPTVVNQPPVTVVTTPAPEVIQVPAGSNAVIAPTDGFEVVQ